MGGYEWGFQIWMGATLGVREEEGVKAGGYSGYQE